MDERELAKRSLLLIDAHNFTLKNFEGKDPLEVAGKCVQHYVDRVVDEKMDRREKFQLKIWSDDFDWWEGKGERIGYGQPTSIF